MSHIPNELWSIIIEYLGTCPMDSDKLVLSDCVPSHAFISKNMYNLYFHGRDYFNISESDFVPSWHKTARDTFDPKNAEKPDFVEFISTVEQLGNAIELMALLPARASEVPCLVDDLMTPQQQAEHITSYCKNLAQQLGSIYLSDNMETIHYSERQTWIIIQFLHRTKQDQMINKHNIFDERRMPTILRANEIIDQWRFTEALNFLLLHCMESPDLYEQANNVSEGVKKVLFKRFGWTRQLNDYKLFLMPKWLFLTTSYTVFFGTIGTIAYMVFKK